MSAAVRIGDQLPDLDLRMGSGVSLNPRRPADGAFALLFAPPAEPRGSAYARAFIRAEADLEKWDARTLLVIGSSEQADAVADAGTHSLVTDRDGKLRDRLGISDDTWTLVIADRWGVVYDVVCTGDASDLPSVAELEEWFKFLATQCPECGVIDDPDPGWNSP